MATVIDTLLVKLGFESSGFEAGKRKVDKGLAETGAAAEKAGVKLKKASKDGADGFNTMAVGAVKFLAVIGGTAAIKQFVSHVIESNAALDRFSQNIQKSANDVSAWSNAAEIAGGTAGGLQGTFDMLSKSQTELQLTGQSGLIPYFAALGVSMADLHGKARPVDDILLDLSDRFSRMDRTTANNMGRSMGIDQGTMNLLLKGRSEVELMIARQKEFGAVTKQQAEESRRMQEQLIRSKQTFEAFGRELISAAIPYMEKLFAAFGNLGDWMHQNREFVETFLSIVAVGMGAIAASLIPINLTALGVLALGAAISALYQDYLVWKRGGESLIDWAQWEPGIKAAGEGILWLKKIAADAFYRMFAGADAVRSALNGDWERAKFAIGEFVHGNTDSGNVGTPKTPNVLPTGAAGALSFFESKGWSKAQAAGIVANLQAESGMNPAAVGDKGKAYGVAQWHPDRQANFAKWAGKDIRNSTLAEQLAFAHYELTEGSERGAGTALRRAVTAQRAGEIVSRQYERPTDGSGEASRRGLAARNLALGISGASSFAEGASASGRASLAANGRPSGGVSVETNVGEVKIYTAATDAAGIARDFKNEIDYLYTAQADSGTS